MNYRSRDLKYLTIINPGPERCIVNLGPERSFILNLRPLYLTRLTRRPMEAENFFIVIF